MVDTALRPRPNFYTFLQSDSNKGGDGLTYYDYQRALRSNKVAVLQQKKAMSYEQPGFKKPAILPASRKIFQLKNKTTTFNLPGERQMASNQSVDPQIKKSDSNESVSSDDSNGDVTESSNIPTSANITSPNNTSMSATQAQTERLPHILKKPRLVKSATARDQQISDEQRKALLLKRPKTVSGSREMEVQTSESQLSEGISHQPKPLLPPPPHHRSQSEGSNDLKKYTLSLAEREELCKAYQWGTTTQRAYNEVGWAERIPPPIATPPLTTIEQCVDPVSQKVSFKRYHSEPAAWQIFGTEWDHVQSRRGDGYPKGPQAINFFSSSKKTQQIPGYQGYIPQLNMFDDQSVMNIVPQFLIRTIQPRKANMSRKADIPGYMGQVHWTKTSPTNGNMSYPEPTTSARIHRMLPLENEMSPYRREGVFSKMITTVSPHNPFNKVQH